MNMTHAGVIVGSDARVSSGFTKAIQLRETKLYWVSDYGHKFKKTTGYGTGDWPLYRLKLSSVKKMSLFQDLRKDAK